MAAAPQPNGRDTQARHRGGQSSRFASPGGEPDRMVLTEPGRPSSPWLADFCKQLCAVIAGRAPAGLAGRTIPAGRSSLVVLPSWLWAPPSGAFRGKKTLRAVPGGGSGQILLPIRVAWDPSPVVVLAEGETATVEWAAIGLGLTRSGVTAIASVDRSPDPTGTARLLADADSPAIDRVGPPRSVPVASSPARSTRRTIAELTESGRSARRQITEMLAAPVARSLRAAHHAAAAELGPAVDGTRRLVDALDIEAMASEMLLGQPDCESTPFSIRLIERCLNPSAFTRVDPHRYVSSAIRVEATAVMRKRIGDPHIGPKIRSTARRLGSTNVEAVVAAYRASRPSDRLGHERCARALDLSSRANGPPLPMPFFAELDGRNQPDGHITGKRTNPPIALAG